MTKKTHGKLQGKRWSKDFEEPIRARWRKEKPFRFNPKAPGKVFSIDTPPPYVNAPVHMGHAVTYTIMDFIARFKRMTGHNVLFPLGLDRNGLPIEMAAQKKYGVSMEKNTREEFVDACKRILEEMSGLSIDTFYRLGHTYNTWDIGTGLGEVYLTDSDDYRKMTQATFIDLWNRGLIKKDKRVSNYCPVCQTTIADAEIEYRELASEFVHVKWKVKETGKEIVIATTRPELICSCSMVIYSKGDERYKGLEGKHAVLPLYGREVPIKAHPAARADKGSGLAMMCSFGDYSDILFYRDEKLSPIISIGKDGRMNEKSGFLKGLRVGEAREEMKKRLDKAGLLVKRERISHRTPICERSKDPLEFIELTELYLEQLNWKTPLRRDVASKTKFFAPRSRQLLIDWMNALSMDWAVSRRRYYATEIPLWYCEECGETIVPPKGRYYRPWNEAPPAKECPKCRGKKFRGEERVFDTWFDSSISPIAVHGYDHTGPFFRKHSPCSLRPQGKDIVRTWLYYTLLRCYQLTGKPIFENIWIHQHVVDENGKKMSKSLGNVVDPRDAIERFGAETFRIWCALEGDITTIDIRCSYERIESAGKFLNKLWNVARFVSGFEPPRARPDLRPLDMWILGELNGLIEFSEKEYGKFNFHKPMTMMKHFIWETFASHYLELVKNRAYNQSGDFSKGEQAAAIETLNRVLDTVLLLISPVAAFSSHRIYRDLRGKDIEKEPFPEKFKVSGTPKHPDGRKGASSRTQEGTRAQAGKPGFTTQELTDLNSLIWKAKKDQGLSLKAGVALAVIPPKFKPIEKDLAKAHSIERIEWGKEFSIVLDK